MAAIQKRKRSKLACDTCRKLKRKCDGNDPCGTCVRFEYDCTFQGTLAKTGAEREPLRSAPVHPMTPIPPAAEGESLMATPHSPLRSLEANSAAAFVRRLALRMDPKNAPRMHLFAWNAFLGERDTICIPVSRPITELVSQSTMQTLSAVYFDRVDPVYGFVDRQEVEEHMKTRWSTAVPEQPYDAVLLGIAALAFLFSHVQPVPTEMHLAESARVILEREHSRFPTAKSITAWVLRVTYLRMTGNPHEAWMASCMLLHMVEAAGLHTEPSKESVFARSGEDISPEIRRRLVGVSQHLNTWMSFDMGRARIIFHNSTTVLPSTRRGDHTLGLLELLPYFAILDPQSAPNASELESALSEVLSLTHFAPPVVLAQVNLMLCICRRLQSMNVLFTGALIDQILSLSMKGIQAAQTLVDTRAPWHHMINVPFQVVCILLAIDTHASVACLKDVMRCLNSVVSTYNTAASREALNTASLLIMLQKRRKEKCASNLNEVLKLYPVTNLADSQTETRSQQPEAIGWLDGLMSEIQGLEHFDIDQILNQGLSWDLEGTAMPM